MPLGDLGGLVAPTLTHLLNASQVVPLAAVACPERSRKEFVKPQVDLLERLAEKAAGLVAMFLKSHPVIPMGGHYLDAGTILMECVQSKRGGAGSCQKNAGHRIFWGYPEGLRQGLLSGDGGSRMGFYSPRQN